MTFGKNLQKLRKEKGLSQDALANRLYVTRQSVSQWENDRTMPSVDLLLKLSEVFDTTVDAMLGKAETESIPQPTAKIGILRNKKDILTAMRYGYSTVRVILISLAALFAGTGLLTVYVENSVFSPEVTALTRNDFLGAWQSFAAAGLFFAAWAVFFIIAFADARRAVGFAGEHNCSLAFYHDHIVIEEEGAEPLSLFYTNIGRITETDGYFIIKMRNGARMCVDKREAEDPEELSKLLKGAKNYLDRRLYKAPSRAGRVKRSLVRFFRDFLFVSTLFMYTAFTFIFAIVTAVVTEPQALRFLIFAAPFFIMLSETAAGTVFAIVGIKAKRMIIAGCAGLVFLTAAAFVAYGSVPVYDLQNDRMTSERFTGYMESHGMTVEDATVGRQELFLTKCLKASPADKSYEILFLEFDSFAPKQSLFTAYAAYGDMLNDIRSQPRQTTRDGYLDLGFNQLYSEITNNRYAYVSLNEFSVFYVDAPLEAKDDVMRTLGDLRLATPYEIKTE